MSGEYLQQLIYAWVDEHYPDGPNWQEPLDQTYMQLPIEIKMILAFDAIEYNIGNGGWAQFLWNCCGAWRELIEDAREGYMLIGAEEQVKALDKLEEACERDENECEAAMMRAAEEEDFSYFGDFVSRGYANPAVDWDRAFFSGRGTYEKRLNWLVENEAKVRKAVQKLHA